MLPDIQTVREVGALLARFWAVYIAAIILAVSWRLIRNRMQMIPVEVRTRDMVRFLRALLLFGLFTSIGGIIGLLVLNILLHFGGRGLVLGVALTGTIIIIVLVSTSRSSSKSQ